LQAYFVAELLQSWEEYLVPNFQILIADVLEHFKDFDDDDLKCMLNNGSLYFVLMTIQADSISMCHFITEERNMNLSVHWSMLKMLSLWQLLPETRRDRLNHCEPLDG
jgi:hypothetical protein